MMMPEYQDVTVDRMDSVDIPPSSSVESIASSVLGSIDPDSALHEPFQSEDLNIIVSSPEKVVSTLETYITFGVFTRSSRPEIGDGEFKVRRRYKDFCWLRGKLTEEYPTRIIPPIPEKHNLREHLDRYDKEFVFHRMFLLNRFLLRVALHPILGKSGTLKSFLTARPGEFQVLRRDQDGLWTRISSSMHHMAHLVLPRPRLVEFEKHFEYLVALSDHLSATERNGIRIHHDRKAVVRGEEELPLAFRHLAGVDQMLERHLERLGEAQEAEVNAAKHLIHWDQKKFLLPLREWMLLVEAAKEALKRRDGFQAEHEAAVDDLDKKIRAKEELLRGEISSGAGGGGLWGALGLKQETEESRQDRVERLEKEIQSLRTVVEEKGKLAEKANTDLREELSRWHEAKRNELKAHFMDNATRHVEFYEKALEAWERVLASAKEDEGTFR